MLESDVTFGSSQKTLVKLRPPTCAVWRLGVKITWSRYGIPKPLGGVHNMKNDTQRIDFFGGRLHFFVFAICSPLLGQDFQSTDRGQLDGSGRSQIRVS